MPRTVAMASCSGMRAVRTSGHGGLEKLEYGEDVTTPTPGRDEVLIRVGACGMNNTDINTRTGWYSQSVSSGTTADGGRAGFGVTSGGLGTMGFGLPAAIGSQVAFPDALVVDVAGDGSIQMNIQELATAKQYNTPVKVAILNNNYLGMVRQWQELLHGERYSESYMDSLPDFVKLAESYGHVGVQVENPGDVEDAMREGTDADFGFYNLDSAVGLLRPGTVRTGDVYTAESWENLVSVVTVRGSDVRGEFAADYLKVLKKIVTLYETQKDVENEIGRAHV